MRPRRTPADDELLSQGEWDALFEPFTRARAVLAAVSGGPDSTALMRGLARWRGSLPVFVACVDHGLRPGSAGEARSVVEAAARLGLPAAILTWTGPKPERALQEAAREARYRLLIAHAQEIGADHLATAHTLDDQAETILIRLSRGSGLAGLAGMRPWRSRGGLVQGRPFLTVPKTRLVATCRAEGWAFLEDPSNADPRFARARWRTLMPALAREGLNARRLALLAERLGRAEEALGQKAENALDRAAVTGPKTGWQVAAFLSEPFEIALRMLSLALDRAEATGPEPRLERLETCLKEIQAAVASGSSLRRTLAGRMISLDRRGYLTIAPEPERRRGRPSSEPDVEAAKDGFMRGRGSRLGFSHVDAAGAPHSLGKGCSDT